MQIGSEYIMGHYLGKVSGEKGLAKPVYVYPLEIFCPAVSINQDQLCLATQED